MALLICTVTIFRCYKVHTKNGKSKSYALINAVQFNKCNRLNTSKMRV